MAAAVEHRHSGTALPELHVSASHEVLAQFREYERCSTTVIDAYLSPLLASYLGRLGEAASSAGLPRPLVMQSNEMIHGKYRKTNGMLEYRALQLLMRALPFDVAKKLPLRLPKQGRAS